MPGLPGSRPRSSAGKEKRSAPVDVKGKGKAKPAIRGRGSQARQARRQTFEEELAEIEERLELLDPRASTSSSVITKFSELPLTRATQAGLSSAYFHTTTSIQGRSLPYTLKGHDLLASARTGSGKTLAFLVPLLEKLYRAKWGPNDGLGAIVLSPTRELAVQIFEVLRKIGHQHSFSAGLVIGGKSLKDEQERLGRMNILVATPGRLLQHMDQTISFDVSNVQLLVLDEADRILDLGFSKTLDAIIQNLPPSGPNGRQTLLFSATQTDSIQALARLSLHDPVYISVRDQDNDLKAITGEDNSTESKSSHGQSGFNQYETPKNLEQSYMVVDLNRKIDTLWSFVKSHLGCKTLVFMSSCKQVRFVYETFRHLRPGISLLHLHGKQKQSKRLEIFQKFTASSHAVLFATDIASRGLDFPSVNWVVQLDCPEDVASYIHRVGRTARYNSKGKSLLMLLPSEREGFEKRLRDKKLLVTDDDDATSSKHKLKFIKMNAQQKEQTIQKQIQSLLFRFNELKTLAQRAFVSYLRSIYLQKDKSTFKIDALAEDRQLLERYAKSLGLAGSPKIKFKGQQKEKEMKEKKNKPRQLEALAVENEERPAVGKKTKFTAEDEDDSEEDLEDAHPTAEVDEYPETSDEEPSDPEEMEDDTDDDDDEDDGVDGQASRTAEAEDLGDSTSEDSEEETSVLKMKEKGAPIQKANSASKAPTSLIGGGEDDSDEEDDGDFLTLAPTQRHLTIADDMDMVTEGGQTSISALASESGKSILPLSHEDISKRKLKQGVTKKGLKTLRGQGEKLIFDDEGTGHALYELVDDKTLSKEEIESERHRFLLEQGTQMRDVDISDKAAIKELRREKKIARKEREREVDRLLKGGNNSTVQAGAGAGPTLENDEGEIVPDFDDISLPSDEDADRGMDATDDDDAAPSRSNVGGSKRKRETVANAAAASAVEEENDLEAMALQALRKKSRK